MFETKKKGNLTELQCITAFTEMGALVSIPFGEDSRYDFIADIDNKLIKIQCKSSSELVDNNEVVAIVFKTVRQNGSNSKTYTRTKYTKEEIDYFATFYNGQCYIVPVEQCSNEKRLRFVPPKNGQTKGINWAKDYELKEVYNKL